MSPRFLAGPAIEDGVYFLALDLGDCAWVHVGWIVSVYWYTHRPVFGLDMDDYNAIAELIEEWLTLQKG